MSFAARPIGLAASNFVFVRSISTDTTNYDFMTDAVAVGWDGVTPISATITVESGIVVSANDTSIYGFDMGASALPVGSLVSITNNGYILGMGGLGATASAPYTNSTPGGPALRTSSPITITNNGTIGGGGGGGGSAFAYYSGYSYSGNGGGGRSGRTDSARASTRAGTFTAPGTGNGIGGTYPAGGNGGQWGAAGNPGTRNAARPPSDGGACTVGNAHITWAVTGTRLGALT